MVDIDVLKEEIIASLGALLTKIILNKATAMEWWLYWTVRERKMSAGLFVANIIHGEKVQ